MSSLYHPRTVAALASITPGGISGYIFHGAAGSGKRRAAIELAMRLNCMGNGTDNCERCRQIDSGNYPDLIVIEPIDKSIVTIDQIRHVITRLALAPYYPGGVRLVVIDEATTLSAEAQNALLKSLEEPPPGTRFILLATALEALLPTVRSRLAAIYFAPVPTSELAGWLEHEYQLKPAVATALATSAAGLVGEAVRRYKTPEYKEQQQVIIAQANLLATGSPYERLKASRWLSEAKINPAVVLTQVQSRLHQTIGTTSTTATYRNYSALEAAYRLIQGGVLPRIVFDRLAVELGA